jgi:hypothetical protein
MLAIAMVGRDAPLSFAVRSGEYELGILGGHLVVRRTGTFARLAWALEATELANLLTREDSLPIADASVHYSGGVLRIYRLGQPLMVLAVAADQHYVAVDLAEEVRRRSGAY